MINAKLDGENIYYSDEGISVSSAVDKLVATGKKNILYIYDALTPSAIAKLSGYVKGRVLRKTELHTMKILLLSLPKLLKAGKLLLKRQ